ncbi:MAG TPA: prolipoprotein diacylglyceryl transferase [bacterium]|nr:prolipoprotein diacylglyceryl transferase [bacterium]
MHGWIYVHHLNPILVQVGPLRIGWYGVMYAVSFLAGYVLLLRDARQGRVPLEEAAVPNLVTYLILGVVVGGRLGWVLFYGGMDYVREPWRILETWNGGMSFHGGLIGVVLVLALYGWRHHIPLLELGDAVVLYVPVGLFFGRIGNFINGELYGKPTDGSWGVVFPGDRLQLPRHPSELYEAALEGVVMFLALLGVRRWVQRPGVRMAVFVVLYGLARTAVEFVRLPDADIGYLAWGFLTMGQVLSAPMWLGGLLWLAWLATHPAQPTIAARQR